MVDAKNEITQGERAPGEVLYLATERILEDFIKANLVEFWKTEPDDSGLRSEKVDNKKNESYARKKQNYFSY